eukprot:NODE_5867_length_600_cov_18.167019_g5702_i0.p2 GENE.NODE_5867_length_600_cov_18.167019_g5702_i0~~NODE_5867_length_600_cov_18.167019_g5702_i0.p2  ORF type:complete len:192 (+),score=84.56 NODE_5867_length_600_cov_18.167019_g5702_i0:41-577(+)
MHRPLVTSTLLGLARMTTKVKETTGLCGFEVEPKWRYKLIQTYELTLKHLEQIPEENPYRRATENLTKSHLELIQGTTDYEVVETTLGLGQVEQLLRNAETELALLKDYAIWKPWQYDQTILDRMDVSFRTTIGGHYTKRAYEKMDDIEDEKLLLREIEQEVETEKVAVRTPNATKAE